MAYLGVLTAVALSAGTFAVYSWFDAGLDVRHAEDLRAAQLVDALRRDPAFQDVELFVSGKHFFWFRGHVDSEGDLDRLRALAHGYDLQVGSVQVQIKEVPVIASTNKAYIDSIQ